jgi:hypothetical protein
MSPGPGPFSSEPAPVFMVSGKDAKEGSAQSAPPRDSEPEQNNLGNNTINISIS